MKKLEELAISRAPWRVCPKDDTMVTTKGGFRVAAGCCERYDGGVGNACIIAAAPELYEELRKAYEFIEQVGDAVGGLPADVIVNQRNARKALAKAAGEEVEK